MTVISFDLDGTLVQPDYIDEVWMVGLPTIYSEEKGIKLEDAKKLISAEYDIIGEGSLNWYIIDYWFDRFDLESSPQELLEKYRERVSTYPEVFDVLTRLEKKYRLVLSSNASRPFLNLEIETAGLDRFFSHTFSSPSDFSLLKNSAEFYRKVLNILDIDSKDIVHVGDNYRCDYLAPKEIGIRSYFLDRSNSKEGKSVVSDLLGFEEVLDGFV